MSLTSGTKLAHYEIVEPLGKGGMGEVYVAEDTKLKRRVALKVLPSNMAEDPDALARFRREAVAIAALNHPNIVTIHSVEESDGVHFLTMELIDGKPLAEVIEEGTMTPSRLLEIALPLARALGVAHTKGITHRDLKPQNVMIASGGTVKILDFGLAKWQPSPTMDDVDSAVPTEVRTQRGTVVGTFPYMSPEQAQGRNVDPRSDIFSFGVMLYEMASGRKPFTGDNAIATLSSILKDDPPPVEGLPNDLAAVVRRCLAKDPDERFQSGEELADALTSKTGGNVVSAPTDIPRIVVRSFKARAGDDELASFAEGLTEDIVAGLALFFHLSVITEDSASSGDKRFAIEGTLRKSGANVRANVKLIDCKTGSHLWAEQFDRELGAADVFAAQDELTDRIVATVADTSGVLTRALVTWVKKKPVSELNALECVLRTFGYSFQWRPDEHAVLRSALERAVEREPDHASAWACLSEVYLDEHRMHYNARRNALDRALSAAQRAVELDARNQLAYRALAEAHYSRRELVAFRAAGERVLSLNPRDTRNIAMIGVLLCYSEDWEKGMSIIRSAMAMNPHHVGWFNISQAFAHYRKHDYENALRAAEKINMPGFPGNHILLAISNGQLGHAAAAKRNVEDLLKLSPRYGKFARADMLNWFVSEEFVQHILEGLQKAGLDVDVSAGS